MADMLARAGMRHAVRHMLRVDAVDLGLGLGLGKTGVQRGEQGRRAVPE